MRNKGVYYRIKSSLKKYKVLCSRKCKTNNSCCFKRSSKVGDVNAMEVGGETYKTTEEGQKESQ